VYWARTFTRMFGGIERGVSTGCSMHSRKTTLAIVNSTSVEQLPAAISMAVRVLKPAHLINNSVHLAIFGTGLSDARPAAVQNVGLLKSIAASKQDTELAPGLVIDDVHLIVSAHDLALLRLAPHAKLGELCYVPGCGTSAGECDAPLSIDQMGEENIASTIECIRRRPAISFQNERDLPFSWKEHMQDIRTFDWLQDLWLETVKTREAGRNARQIGALDDKHGDLNRGTSPFDVLSLCMYAKMASIASRTTELAQGALRRIGSTVTGSVGLGLMRLFPENGVAPSVLSFVSEYLEGGDLSWKVSPRGKEAAKKARTIMRKVFDHASTVLSVLKHGKVAEIVHSVYPSNESKNGGVLLVQGGPTGTIGKLILGKVPLFAVSENHKFRMVFTKPTKNGWVHDINSRLQEIVETLSNQDEAPDTSVSERVRSLISAYAALASTHVEYDTYVDDKSLTSRMESQPNRIVTTFPSGIASHLERELVIMHSVIQTSSTSACVSVQQGTSVSCVFCTFCPTTMEMLKGKEFTAPSVTRESVLKMQADVDIVAKSLDRPYNPIGMLSGTIGPVVSMNEQPHRVVYWKIRGDTRDSVVTLFPPEYIDIIFADYATGSRNIRMSDTENEISLPFFAAETMFALSSASVLPGSNSLAFRLPKLERMGFLGTDESELYASYSKYLDATDGVNVEIRSVLDRSFRTLNVRETEDDRLAGLRVQWMRRGSIEPAIFALVSDNSAFEQLLY